MFVGTNDICFKLTQVPVKMEVSVHEIQPSNNGILIFLSGLLTIEGETQKINFVRVFFLAPTEQGSIYIKNDMYKITFG